MSDAPFSPAAAAREAPAATALIADGVAISYARLREDVEAAAAHLGAGGSHADGVAFVAEPTYARLLVLYAAVARGLPAALLHPRWPERLRADMVAACGAWSLEREPLAAIARHAAEASPSDRGTGRAAANGTAATGRRTRDPMPLDDRRPLALVATSGTGSGRPRWAVLSRAALRAAVAMSAARLGWRSDDRWLLSLPPAHVGGLAIVLRTLAARRTAVVAELDWSRPASVLAVMRRDRVTLASLVPTQLDRLLAIAGRAPSTLRAVLVGGAAAAPSLLARSRRRGWPVLATYGATETCAQITCQRPDAPGPPGSCGPPLDGIELRIDADGVIAVRGPNLMSGYLPPSDVPPIDVGGWLRTGDRGRLDDRGELRVLGRADDVISSGGENVDPAAVEAALLEHPRVAEAVVFGVSDASWGEAVAALIVARHRALDDPVLLRHLDQRLPAFARPRRIAWVDRLPRTAMGKPDRRAARRFADRLRPLSRPGSTP